ncbi:hypothetical protein PG997_006004 [Apiospora hydei]|uniref:Uncharacterized protein n=1 Tax=Apiospora hydei TaxID=1337664 RepID=A0ABR1WMI4_9PEZI
MVQAGPGIVHHLLAYVRVDNVDETGDGDAGLSEVCRDDALSIGAYRPWIHNETLSSNLRTTSSPTTPKEVFEHSWDSTRDSPGPKERERSGRSYKMGILSEDSPYGQLGRKHKPDLSIPSKAKRAKTAGGNIDSHGNANNGGHVETDHHCPLPKERGAQSSMALHGVAESVIVALPCYA